MLKLTSLDYRLMSDAEFFMSMITTNIHTAISELERGEVVAIPTETVYGLAGCANNEQSIHKIYALKNRPLTHPLIMHVATGWDLEQWVTPIPDYAQQLMDYYWPGPLTIVLPCKPGQVSPLVTGGQTTVALRCPKHPIAQAVLAQLQKPLVAPSANPFGKISPTTAMHVQQSFPDSSLLILDGGRCGVGIESTIIAAINRDGYQILREGIIDATALERVAPYHLTEKNIPIRTPGQMASHYQPNKPLYCFNSSLQMKQFCQQNSQQLFVLSFCQLPENVSFGFQLSSNPKEVAYELYYQLRLADESHDVGAIVMELPPATPPWQGIRDRVLKAGRLLLEDKLTQLQQFGENKNDF